MGKPLHPLGVVDGAVGGDRTAFAYGDDETVSLRRPVAIDEEAGRIGPNERRIEPHRQLPGHA